MTLPAWEDAPVEEWAHAWRIPALLAFESVSSTNDVIRLAGLDEAPAGTTAIADHQLAGRGRLGRTWTASPRGSLLCSVLLRPEPGGRADAAGVLPLRIGLAIADAIAAVAGVQPALKWPNDVLIEGRKVAGILCEATAEFIVAGFGINVAQSELDFPAELRTQATSLRIVTGVTPSRPDLAGAILTRLTPLFAAPHRPLDGAELQRFAALDALAGRAISVDDVPAGTARGIDPLGALRVSDGQLERRVHAGTVRSHS